MPTRDQEIWMMKNPSNWPHTTRLPLKNDRKGSGFNSREHGFLRIPMTETPVRPVVYLGNMFALTDVDLLKKEEFESFEALVDAGWEVD